MGIINSELDVEFYLDNGVSEHTCNDISLFGNYMQLKQAKQIKIAYGIFITAIRIGTVCIQPYNGEKYIETELQNVHILYLKINLFSQGKALHKDLYVTSNAHSPNFIHQKSIEIVAIVDVKMNSLK